MARDGWSPQTRGCWGGWAGSPGDILTLRRTCVRWKRGDSVSTLLGIRVEDRWIEDPSMDMALGVGLLHELWVSAEPAGYATHITSDPLPGSGPAKRILMTAAWLDQQVANQATEILARTMGLPNGEGSIQQGLQQIPDIVGPADSALVIWDAGSFDILDPVHQPLIPPLANLLPVSKCDPTS